MRYSSFGRVAALAFTLFAAEVVAQTFRVTPGDSLPAGGSASLDYRDPSRAGQSIAVTISGGFPVVTTTTVTIQLDENGNGIGTWAVPTNWRNASFVAPGVAQIDIPIS